MNAIKRPTLEIGPESPRMGEHQKTRVLFVNGGILGLQSFSKYITEAMACDTEVEALHINLCQQMTLNERIVRRIMCAPLWPDGLFGLRNLDFARLRREYHAGLQARRRMRSFLARGIDVLHFHRTATAYASLGVMRRVPAIISMDCTQDIVIQSARSGLERWTYGANAAIDGRIFRAAAAIVSTSRWAAGCLRARYPDCDTPVHVMPPPVRLQFFDERWLDERDLRAQPDYLPRVLFVGGDFVRKGGDDLLAAWRSAELYRSARLILVTGWPVDVSAVPGVQVIRHVESYSAEWSDLWRAADIFVMPTRDEAFGTVFQEAAAAGLARIGTRLNAIPETIADGRSGMLIAPGDRAALALAMRTLIDSASLRRAFGAAARADVVERASPDDYRDKLRGIIQSVAQCGATTRRAGAPPLT